MNNFSFSVSVFQCQFSISSVSNVSIDRCIIVTGPAKIARACGHKLHFVIEQVISQYWNKVFTFYNLYYIANQKELKIVWQ